MGTQRRTLFPGRSKTPAKPAKPAQADLASAVISPKTALVPPVEIDASDPLYAYCLTSPGVIEVDNLKLESPSLQAMRKAGIKLVLPLVSQGELVGLLQLGARLSDQEYSSDDFRLLNNLSSQAATALRVAQLAYQQQVEARHRERIESELRVAGIIQQTLLPKEIPVLSGWHLDAHWQPARTVGGDFYDFIPLPGGRWMLIIGDVTDKGVPAALVMASTRSILRAASDQATSPGEVLRRANEVLCPDMPTNMFATCLCAILDPQSGHMSYANAGHNASVQRTKDGVIELRARGMPLGLMTGMEYEVKETMIAPGDSVLMYSDGIVEAHDGLREMFGMKRLKATLSEYAAGPLIGYMRDALFAFTGSQWEQEDDITFVVLEKQQPAESTGDGIRVLDEFDIPSAPGNERDAMNRVAKAVEALQLPAARIERLKTAVSETTMNAMEHGNRYQPDKPVKISVTADQRELMIRVTDEGGGWAGHETPEPDLDAKLAGLQSPRGWGLFLVKAMVDDMRETTNPGEHIVELVIHIEGGK